MTPTRRAFLTTGVTALGLSVAGCLGDNTDEWEADATLPATTAVQYQSPGCDCCDAYAGYLDDHLDTDLETDVLDDLEAIKAERNIDEHLRGCHTVDLDGYVVEGHVPVEVIATLFEGEPEIDGIALPGMPAGSPGMGGSKSGTWTIYELDADGDAGVYTEL